MEFLFDLSCFTDLQYAAFSGKVEDLKEKLTNTKHLNSRGRAGFTPLQFACSMTNEDCIDILLDNKPSMNIKAIRDITALHIFVQLFPPNERLLKKMLDQGADPNIPDCDGRTPFHHVAIAGQGVSEIMEKYIHLLLRYGADVNSKDNDGCTPLHLAILSDFHGAVTILLQNGAHTNNENFMGITEFHLAVEYQSRYPRVMQRMSEHECLIQHFRKKQNNLYQLERVCQMEEMRTFEERCISELAALKSVTVGDSTVTLYDMFSLSPNELAKKLRNPFINESFFKFDRKMFPIFGQYMFDNVQAGLQSLKAITVAHTFLKKLYPGIPQLCLDKIDSFLSNTDLMKFNMSEKD